MIKKKTLSKREGNAYMSYRVKRMLIFACHWIILKFVHISLPSASAQTGGSFYEPFNNYNTGLWQKADGYSNGNMFNCTWRANNVSMTSLGKCDYRSQVLPIISLTAEKTVLLKHMAMGFMKSA